MEALLTTFVGILKDAGLSPAGVIFAIFISVLMYRGWKKEDALSGRQDEFFKQQKDYYAGINMELKELKKQLDRCEEERHNSAEVNQILDRWKAMCEDACPMAGEVHNRVRRKNGH